MRASVQILLVLLIIPAIIFTGCPKQQLTTQQAQVSTTAAVLPASWPIPELQLPPNSTRALLPPHMRLTPTDFQFENVEIIGPPDNAGRTWVLAFNASLNWLELVEFTDRCLLANGYIVDEERRNRHITSSTVMSGKTYFSTDKTKIVEVTHEKHAGNLIEDPYDAYFIQIKVWEKPIAH